ncbi:hypothetical protein AVEN_135651-1 [Araneus ventricosus]|uniref:Uncharacterized protein n=1 Tax=Araneus ventricosus TaxID=182803 RepID=A0A4Y2EJP7_ARAVE|nr:hypothetical protein AVEN_135651-1 [Araneus ventricosus]
MHQGHFTTDLQWNLEHFGHEAETLPSDHRGPGIKWRGEKLFCHGVSSTSSGLTLPINGMAPEETKAIQAPAVGGEQISSSGLAGARNFCCHRWETKIKEFLAQKKMVHVSMQGRLLIDMFDR